MQQAQSQNNNDIWQLKNSQNERPTRKTSAQEQENSQKVTERATNGRNRGPSDRHHHRRSHSAHSNNNRSKSETQSEVNSNSTSAAAAAVGTKNMQNQKNSSNSGNSPQKPPGLGRRSQTQLELSRRKRNPNEDVEPTIQKTKWHSQEHLDKVSKEFFIPNKLYVANKRTFYKAI